MDPAHPATPAAAASLPSNTIIVAPGSFREDVPFALKGVIHYTDYFSYYHFTYLAQAKEHIMTSIMNPTASPPRVRDGVTIVAIDGITKSTWHKLNAWLGWVITYPAGSSMGLAKFYHSHHGLALFTVNSALTGEEMEALWVRLLSAYPAVPKALGTPYMTMSRHAAAGVFARWGSGEDKFGDEWHLNGGHGER